MTALPVDATALQSYLAEWYQPILAGRDVGEIAGALGDSAAGLRMEGRRVQLQVVVAAPTDEVLYGVFQADLADDVVEACRRAGWAVDRIVTGVQTCVL